MRQKLIKSSYEDGVSKVTIRTKLGEFTGEARLHKEDKDFASELVGCRYAEVRALIKNVKAVKKVLRIKLEAIEHLEKEMKCLKAYNHYSVEMKRIRRVKDEYKTQITNLAEQIKEAESALNKAMEERDRLVRKLAKGQNEEK